MEVIDISGYSIQEKMEIAKRYLIPKQIKDNGITPNIIEFKDREIEKIITQFTMESGVRNLDVRSLYLISIREQWDLFVGLLLINMPFQRHLNLSRE